MRRWSVLERGAGIFTLTGEISCKGNIAIWVSKALHVVAARRTDVVVQTTRYAYNASVRGHGNVLRHDNIHPHPGHSDHHHRHEFDWRTGKQSALMWWGEHRWPTLGEFIEEAEQW